MPTRPRKRIDRFLNEALEDYSKWLQENEWIGKEHDCVNLFAHRFLFQQIGPNAAVTDPTQICIECALKQPAGYTNRSARKDLVIWEKPLQNTWSAEWEPVYTPKAVMEWKVYRKSLPKAIFNSHDEKWISSYTKEHSTRFGFVVSVQLTANKRQVHWKMSKQGSFGVTRSV